MIDKLYFRILGGFVIFIILLNVLSFLAGPNTRQLTNFFFYDKRAVALFYLTKNIILDTGVNIKKTPNIELIRLAGDAAKKYDIDKNLLLLLIRPDSEYGISLSGGMGLAGIDPAYFIATEFKDPFKPEENINAAALTLKLLNDEMVPQNELIARYLLGDTDIETIRLIAPHVYNNVKAKSEAYAKLTGV